jgi:hypothetical protein
MLSARITSCNKRLLTRNEAACTFARSKLLLDVVMFDLKHALVNSLISQTLPNLSAA